MALDAGDPSSKYNDPEWRLCVEGKALNDTILDMYLIPDSNFVRNDMGAFGGPGGSWYPLGSGVYGIGVDE